MVPVGDNRISMQRTMDFSRRLTREIIAAAQAAGITATEGV